MAKKDKNLKNLRFEITPEEAQRTLNAPYDNSVVENLHGYEVSDPFRPLEDLDLKETADWLDRQSKSFNSYIGSSTKSTKDAAEFMSKALDHDMSSLVSRYENKYFRTFKKALTAQGVVQVSDSEKGPWKTILDPNRLSDKGTVALSGWRPSYDGKHVVYFISESGSDAQTMHIYDVDEGKTLDDKIEDCRFSGVLWDKNSSESFQYTYPTHDGTLRTMIKHHTVGDNPKGDKEIHKPKEDNSFVSPLCMHTAKYEWLTTGIGTDNNHGLCFKPYGSKDDFKEIVKPLSGFTISPEVELDNGSVLAVTNKGASRGKLIKFDPNNPDSSRWQDVIPESDENILSGVILHKGKLFAFYTEDTADAVKVFTPEGEHLYDMPLPIQSVTGYARINPEDDNFTIRISGHLSSGDTYSYNVDKNKLTFVEKSSSPVDLNDCIVERIKATSKDGTKVPMTVIRHPDTKLDGTAALKLYGYGGFNISLRPGFGKSIAHFVKAGGIYVVANLRGGGEFGQKWYDGGRLDKKQNVFDDFIACAEHLIGTDYTSNKRLIINGGSNGGLLTSATMIQRPDLFGAVITEVPVTDMFRFHLATYGAAWKSDYGDPDIKKDFNFSAKYSPLHNVKKGVKYPPHLIKTADHDDRVVPWHAFKLAATLQAKSHKDSVTVMRVEKDAGHGAGKPTKKIIQGYAETHAFIERAIGPINQNEYIKQLKRNVKAKKTHRNKK